MMNSDSGSHTQRLLASNLRRLRVARHMSLSGLARATSMSKATLSGIESARANPTVETLAAIADAMEIGLADLLKPVTEPQMRIIRASAPQEGDRPSQQPLEIADIDGRLQISRCLLPAHHTQRLDALPEGSRLQLLVLSGQLIAGPVERISELARGDYASFPADLQHLLQTGAQEAEVLLLRIQPR